MSYRGDNQIRSELEAARRRNEQIEDAAPTDQQTRMPDRPLTRSEWFSTLTSQTGGPGATSLENLTDVTLENLEDGHLLVWDQADAVFKNMSPATATVSADDLENLALGDLGDVVDGPIRADGDVLAWDATNSHWERRVAPTIDNPYTDADVSSWFDANFVGEFFEEAKYEEWLRDLFGLPTGYVFVNDGDTEYIEKFFEGFWEGSTLFFTGLLNNYQEWVRNIFNLPTEDNGDPYEFNNTAIVPQFFEGMLHPDNTRQFMATLWNAPLSAISQYSSGIHIVDQFFDGFWYSANRFYEGFFDEENYEAWLRSLFNLNSSYTFTHTGDTQYIEKFFEGFWSGTTQFFEGFWSGAAAFFEGFFVEENYEDWLRSLFNLQSTYTFSHTGDTQYIEKFFEGFWSGATQFFEGFFTEANYEAWLRDLFNLPTSFTFDNTGDTQYVEKFFEAFLNNNSIVKTVSEWFDNLSNLGETATNAVEGAAAWFLELYDGTVPTGLGIFQPAYADTGHTGTGDVGTTGPQGVLNLQSRDMIGVDRIFFGDEDNPNFEADFVDVENALPQIGGIRIGGTRYLSLYTPDIFNLYRGRRATGTTGLPIEVFNASPLGLLVNTDTIFGGNVTIGGNLTVTGTSPTGGGASGPILDGISAIRFDTRGEADLSIDTPQLLNRGGSLVAYIGEYDIFQVRHFDDDVSSGHASRFSVHNTRVVVSDVPFRVGKIDDSTDTTLATVLTNGEFVRNENNEVVVRTGGSIVNLSNLSTGGGTDPPDPGTSAGRPVVSVSAEEGTTESTSIIFNILFNQVVTGLIQSEISVSGASGATYSFSGSGSTYQFIVTLPAETTTATVAVNIPAGVAQNSDGDTNLASNTATTVFTAPPVGPAAAGLTPLTSTQSAAGAFRLPAGVASGSTAITGIIGNQRGAMGIIGLNNSIGSSNASSVILVWHTGRAVIGVQMQTSPGRSSAGVRHNGTGVQYPWGAIPTISHHPSDNVVPDDPATDPSTVPNRTPVIGLWGIHIEDDDADDGSIWVYDSTSVVRERPRSSDRGNISADRDSGGNYLETITKLPITLPVLQGSPSGTSTQVGEALDTIFGADDGSIGYVNNSGGRNSDEIVVKFNGFWFKVTLF